MTQDGLTLSTVISEIGNSYRGVDIRAILVRTTSTQTEWICAFLILRFTNNRIDEAEKKEFRKGQLSKFLGASKKVNTLTDFIFEDVKRDREEHKLDALSICGLLLSFVANSQTHLYFAMECIKEAVIRLEKDHNIEEIFSLESPVMQNTKTVTDIRAIRNAISHGSFNIEYDKKKGEWIIDFQSTLTNYQFNKQYTGNQLIDIYSAYDNLKNFQELLIRITLLKATLKIFFITH
jgi:hypothetical protein